MKKHPKTWFTIRLILFVLIGIVGPLAIIYSQYQMFSPRVPDSIKIHGWGIVALLVLAFGTYYVIGSLAKAFSNYFIRQIMAGLSKIIVPILLAYLLVNAVAANVDKIKIILLGSLLCEIIALPLNPIPPLIYKREERIIVKK
jgi:hypothetical protein